MMTCVECRQQLSSYVDAFLEPSERAQLEAHLQGCAECHAALGSLQEMVRALRAMEPPVVPDLLPGIHRALERQPWWRALAQRFTAPWPVSLPWHGVALAATALLVIVVNRAEIEKQTDMKRSRVEGELRTSVNERPASGLLAPQKARKELFFEDQAGEDKTSVGHDAALDASVGSRLLNAQPESSRMNTGAAFGAAGLAKAPAPASAPVSKSAAAPASVQWRVRDVQAAVAEVNTWVAAKHGQVIAVDARRFSVTLPASAVPEFLQRFSSVILRSEVEGQAGMRAGARPDSAPADRPQVTLSLELVPSE